MLDNAKRAKAALDRSIEIIDSGDMGAIRKQANLIANQVFAYSGQRGVMGTGAQLTLNEGEQLNAISSAYALGPNGFSEWFTAQVLGRNGKQFLIDMKGILDKDAHAWLFEKNVYNPLHPEYYSPEQLKLLETIGAPWKEEYLSKLANDPAAFSYDSLLPGPTGAPKSAGQPDPRAAAVLQALTTKLAELKAARDEITAQGGAQ
jgi:hypothetical protein